LPEETVLDTLKALKVDSSFQYVCFSQINEPLLDKRIYSFIRHAKKLGLPVMIITNGLLFHSKEVIDNLLTAQPDTIKLSLHTLNQGMFKDARGIDYSFQQYKRGILNFLNTALDNKSQVIVDLACNFLSGIRNLKTYLLGLDRGDPSIYAKASDLQQDLRAFLNELNLIDQRFNIKEFNINQYLERVSYCYEDEAGLSLAPHIVIKIKLFIYSKRLTEFYPIKGRIGCPTNIVGILANGDVVPCCMVNEGVFNLGNVHQEPLGTILEKSKYFLRGLRDGTNLPRICCKCLGAPSRRGAFAKQMKSRIK